MMNQKAKIIMKINLNILVVDDNEEFCENIKDILELKGHFIQTVNDGFKALEAVQQHKTDLVLIDIKMPVMDGVETFKKLKKIAPGLPVIMITAYAVEELIRESLRSGAFGVLRKPLDFDKLLSIIEDTIKNGSMILVIDDDENLCNNMKDILSRKGYRVSIALDSNLALKKTKENHFDIMLLDMNLPPLNGLETYLTIRDIRPDVVVVIITGYLNEMNDLVNQAKQKGVYTCLEKPVNMDVLISLLEKIGKQKEMGNIKE